MCTFSFHKNSYDVVYCLHLTNGENEANRWQNRDLNLCSQGLQSEHLPTVTIL